MGFRLILFLYADWKIDASNLSQPIADLHSFINESIATSQPNLDASIAADQPNPDVTYCANSTFHHTIGNIDLLHPIVYIQVCYDDFSGSRLKL